MSGAGDCTWPELTRVRGRRAAVGVVVVCIVVVLSACGIADARGVELGHLRDLARRVEGGGAECPLAIPPAAIRSAGVDADAPIVPFRENGPGSEGTIGGDDLPTDDSVRIMCRWAVEDSVVTLVAIGVNRGHAIASFAPELSERGDAGEVLSFMDVNAKLPVDRAAVLPGEPPAAFTRVRASHGDVALILAVDIDTGADDVSPPGSDDLEQGALAMAHALAD